MIELGFAIKESEDCYIVLEDEQAADWFLRNPPTGFFEKVGPVILSDSDIWMLRNSGTFPRSFFTPDLELLKQ